MKKYSFLIFLTSVFLVQYGYTQDNSVKSDSLYYDQWVGEWYKEVDGLLDNEPTFVIKRALYHSSFEEYWIGAGGNFSIAWRAWDTRTQSWEFAWMSSDGLFQNWQGVKLSGIWYMYKTFLINNQEVLSRQAFIPKSEKLVIRTSEHSGDNGKTWKLRFKEIYRKK